MVDIFNLAMMDDIPRRVIIWARVTDITGNPQWRHNTLGEEFCRQILGREFRATLHPSCYDHVHIPPDFDSGNAVKRWFIFDLSVKERLTSEALAQVSYLVYLASCQDGELYDTT